MYRIEICFNELAIIGQDEAERSEKGVESGPLPRFDVKDLILKGLRARFSAKSLKDFILKDLSSLLAKLIRLILYSGINSEPTLSCFRRAGQDVGSDPGGHGCDRVAE